MIGIGKKSSLNIARGLGGSIEQVVQEQLEQLIPGFGELDRLLGGGPGGENLIEASIQNAARAQSVGMGMGVNIGGIGGIGGIDPLAQNALSRPSRIGDSSGVDAQLRALAEVGGGGGYFEDRVFAIMCKVVEDMQRKVEERLNKLQKDAEKAEQSGGGGGGAGGGGGGGDGQESRNIEFEKIKFDMQKLSQMQQAMSNVLNTMDELAKSAIRHIKV